MIKQFFSVPYNLWCSAGLYSVQTLLSPWASCQCMCQCVQIRNVVVNTNAIRLIANLYEHRNTNAIRLIAYLYDNMSECKCN